MWRLRRPCDWSTSTEYSPSQISVEVILNMVTGMWRHPIRRTVWGGNWGSAYSSHMSQVRVRPQSYPKRKTVQSTCRALSRLTCSLWGCLSPTDMWHVDFDCPRSCSCTCSQLHWHGTSPRQRSTLGGGNWVTRQFFLSYPQRSLCVLLGHSVLVHESFGLLRS
jgi:hypothetical protein